MSEYALSPADMVSAGDAASGAAADARGANGSAGLASLASALPGTTTAEIAPQVGEAWESGIDGWSGNVEEFAASIAATSKDASSTDASTGGLFDFLRGLGGG